MLRGCAIFHALQVLPMKHLLSLPCRVLCLYTKSGKHSTLAFNDATKEQAKWESLMERSRLGPGPDEG